MDKLLKGREVAAMFGVSMPTVRRWADEKRLASIRVGKILRFPEKEVKRLLASATSAAK